MIKSIYFAYRKVVCGIITNKIVFNRFFLTINYKTIQQQPK